MENQGILHREIQEFVWGKEFLTLTERETQGCSAGRGFRMKKELGIVSGGKVLDAQDSGAGVGGDAIGRMKGDDRGLAFNSLNIQ